MANIELTKERIKEVPGVLKALEQGIMNGEINPLEMLVIQKSFEKWVEYVKSKQEIQKAIEAEYLKSIEGNKKITFNGVEITQNEKVSWDFSPCPENDTIIANELEIKRLKEQNKAIEETLKARYRIDDLVNIESGEVTGVVKPIKSGSTKYFSVKL